MININIGLFGHIDHGKTELAKKLTEIPSTSALDKPKESKIRGITVDLGFSSFTLDDYNITLVDAPGHAELIRTAIGASNIIDLAILVVDAKESAKPQTGEHLIVLDLLNIPTIVAINKIDIASEEEIKKTELIMRNILNSTKNLKNSKIVKISAKTGEGIDKLKEEIKNLLKKIKIERDTNSYLKMPIDHAFKIKGVGTVVTGTIHKGTLKVGDNVIILPINYDVKVKSIQCFKKDVEMAKAGDRVGVALLNVEPESIYRGCVLTSKDTKLKVAEKFIAKIKVLELFKYNLKPKMKVHIHAGLLTVPAKIIPFNYEIVNDKKEAVVLDNVKAGDKCYCLFILEEPIVLEEGDKVLIMRLDLPATVLRIAGFGEVMGFNDIELKRLIVKEGRIIKKKDKFFVEGLAHSKQIAEKLVGELVYLPEKDKYVKITGTFGTKGLLTIDAEGVEGGEKVILKKVRKWG
ncbi:selenocysteine-specific translation elongation factor [Methanocaldococcus villosus KIN24-T80]|uniref:Selenocysteine-specific elongation factor n=1 Tax=Methanocaldococcus villosus KIN24-T80 TaxID=1069083 RepID=N6UZZ0_9EURY|nr:selenocysteine-specific translation elongation factor [Methanocaldococcus villosus]ENN95598.1 selenocysteine-specific translation elongation factor [Methanocaldococcus villosus KIN24-T80]